MHQAARSSARTNRERIEGVEEQRIKTQFLANCGFSKMSPEQGDASKNNSNPKFGFLQRDADQGVGFVLG